MRTYAWRLTLAVPAVLLLTGACSNNDQQAGGGPSPGASATVAQDAALASTVPAKVKSAGRLVVGVNQPYAPNEYLDNNGKVVGFEVDMMDATAKVLGLGTDYRQSAFDKIIPAVQAGTYDVGLSSFTDTKARERSVDFVNFFSAGIQWASSAGKTVHPDSACGLRVAVQTTTVEDTDDVPARSRACVAAGKPAILKLQFESQDDATSAVVLGKADAMSADSPVTAYAVKQSGGKLQTAGDITQAAPYGWPMDKNSGLVPAMQKALQKLIDDGTYGQISAKWGLQAGAIKTATTNGATS